MSAPDMLQLARLDVEVWWRLFATIKDKRAKLVSAARHARGECDAPPKPNIVQLRMFAAYRQCRAEGRPCKMLVLKPRQVGASTAAQAITYHHFRTFPNLNGALMGDIAGTSDKVFEIFRTYAKEDTYPWKQGAETSLDPADDITLANKSHYGKETAGSKNAGRSGTVQVANATEVAFFPRSEERDPALGFLNSFYDGGEVSLAIFDTTPNGPFGLAYDLWQDKSNSWIKIFAAWFEFPEHVRAFVTEEQRQAFVDTLDDDEREEIERYGVTMEQLHWRRMVIKDKCQNDPDKFRQEYPSNDIECWLASARLAFRAMTIDNLRKLAENCPPRVGELIMQDNQLVAWRPDDAGTVELWEEPREGCKYLVSADTCTGEDQQQGGPKADPDYHSIGVLRAGFTDVYGVRHPARLVAHHWSRLDADLAALIAASMSIWFGRCMVIPEVNNSGLLMVKRLEEWGIPVYYRQTVNRTAGTRDRFAGWRTDTVTRKTIVDDLKGVIREWKPNEPTIDVPCRWVVEQLGKFVVNKNGRAEAMPGAHDDGVLMLAIAKHNETLASTYRAPQRRPVDWRKVVKREGWTTD
jgi:hypothetical protein